MLLNIKNGEKLKKINVLESIHMTIYAWGSVNPFVIVNCYKKSCVFELGEITVVYAQRHWRKSMEDTAEKIGLATSYCEYINVDKDVIPSQILLSW